MCSSFLPADEGVPDRSDGLLDETCACFAFISWCQLYQMYHEESVGEGRVILGYSLCCSRSWQPCVFSRHI